ncbi:MAG: Sec-independent protein translocase protein TatB [Aquimonas sp.]|jgi:sec-independent protein translocase protein TatB
MFDLSIAEIGVIGVVALLVLGPERLPKAARTLGFYVKKARQSWFAVRSEFERELAAEELKRSLKLDEVHATLQDTAKELRADAALAGLALGAAAAEANASLGTVSGPDPLPAALSGPERESPGAQAENVDDEAQGLTPEEIARQRERFSVQFAGLEDELSPATTPVAALGDAAQPPAPSVSLTDPDRQPRGQAEA